MRLLLLTTSILVDFTPEYSDNLVYPYPTSDTILLRVCVLLIESIFKYRVFWSLKNAQLQRSRLTINDNLFTVRGYSALDP